MRILLVDDETAIAETIGEILEIEGFEVVLADDGLMGLQRMEEQAFDLVIVDYMMPFLDGPGFIEKVVEKYNPPPPKIIMISAGYKVPVPETADGFLRKPFSIDKLLELIGELG